MLFANRVNRNGQTSGLGMRIVEALPDPGDSGPVWSPPPPNPDPVYDLPPQAEPPITIVAPPCPPGSQRVIGGCTIPFIPPPPSGLPLIPNEGPGHPPGYYPDEGGAGPGLPYNTGYVPPSNQPTDEACVPGVAYPPGHHCYSVTGGNEGPGFPPQGYPDPGVYLPAAASSPAPSSLLGRTPTWAKVLLGVGAAVAAGSGAYLFFAK